MITPDAKAKIIATAEKEVLRLNKLYQRGIITEGERYNQVLDALTDDERARVGVHTCPGGDQDSTHSADIDYADLLPTLFRMHVGSFFIQLASESDRERVLGILRGLSADGQRIFVGVTDPISSHEA